MPGAHCTARRAPARTCSSGPTAAGPPPERPPQLPGWCGTTEERRCRRGAMSSTCWLRPAPTSRELCNSCTTTSPGASAPVFCTRTPGSAAGWAVGRSPKRSGWGSKPAEPCCRSPPRRPTCCWWSPVPLRKCGSLKPWTSGAGRRWASSLPGSGKCSPVSASGGKACWDRRSGWRKPPRSPTKAPARRNSWLLSGSAPVKNPLIPRCRRSPRDCSPCAACAQRVLPATRRCWRPPAGWTARRCSAGSASTPEASRWATGC